MSYSGYFKFNYGLTLKYIYSKIDNSHRQVLAADMGFIYSIENDVMLFGFVIQNFGMKSEKRFYYL
ncbi:hypothetical protein ATZ36_11475 [Candidatus Endomicrobiellum trichonymphae]|uniref:Uncharacterized protein n=1 Tax=Endomicrobium trichonymphae TaxID=1408204 RepID=A0A1E5IF31_ENDTX|nr:hypothetical protein ATZ36_11475 [Candidatus Endomicrobium trichonymphae]